MGSPRAARPPAVFVLVLLLAAGARAEEEERERPPSRLLHHPEAVPAAPGRADSGERRPLPPPVVRAPGPVPGSWVQVAPEAPARPAPSQFPAGRTPVSPSEGRPDLEERPTAPPARPAAAPAPRPQDLVFEVGKEGGVMRAFQDGEGRAVLVMWGDPRILGFAHRRATGEEVPPLSVKANAIVAWIDLEEFTALQAFQGMRLGGAPPRRESSPDDRTPTTSILQEAVLGIYAEGAVELVFGDLLWRAERLHIEPRTFQALFIEPRFDGAAQGVDIAEGDRLPIHIRARQARLVARGSVEFEDAEVSTSPDSGALQLRVARLSVREVQENLEPVEGEKNIVTLLGFRNLSAQTYRAEAVELWGERVPLMRFPTAEFGYPDWESFPTRVRRADAGNRSNLGVLGFAGLGGPVGAGQEKWGDWTLDLGGYVSRGPAGGVQFEWDRPKTWGNVRSWMVGDFGGPDRSGFQAPHTFRYHFDLENRNRLTDRLTIDTSLNAFSDRGFELEYFERQRLEERDPDTYVRARYEHGVFVGALDGSAHLRDFVTESNQEPQLSLWAQSVPLVAPANRALPSLDVTTTSQAGRLVRRHDVQLLDPDYEATRLNTDTRIWLGWNLGDLRFSSWAGGAVTSYHARSDGPDRTRSALLAGARANLQLHRTYAARGGWFQLDQLRHVIDTDLEYGGRFLDDLRPGDVPHFDRYDAAIERSAATLRIRNRVQTRRPDGGVRDLADLELSLIGFVREVGPLGVESPGAIQAFLRGEPRANFLVSGEFQFDLGGGERDRFFTSAGFSPWENVSVTAGMGYVEGTSIAPQLDLSWRWSEKYAVRLTESYDFEQDQNRFRLLFRRHSPDHVWIFGVNQRSGENLEFQVNFEPKLGGARPGDMSAFNDVPDLDPRRAFPR